VVTDYALYRLEKKCNEFRPKHHRKKSMSRLRVSWRTEYNRGKRIKPGQNQQGSGTTPTCFNDFDGNQFVTIADNADPYMHVLIFGRNRGDLIAQQAVFLKLPYKNACENSLIAVNHSVLIENNYGNFNIASTLGPKTTQPGISRVDFKLNGESSLVWENYTISIPSVVSQMSTRDGLIYTYAKDAIGWYFAAVDYKTGQLIEKMPIPRTGIFAIGALANNFYGGIGIGPNGTIYAGVFGGILSWRVCIEKNE